MCIFITLGRAGKSGELFSVSVTERL